MALINLFKRISMVGKMGYGSLKNGYAFKKYACTPSPTPIEDK